MPTTPDSPHPARAAATAAFTLIELMVVVAILGLLTALVVPALADDAATAERTKAQTDLRTIEDAAYRFRLQQRRWPTIDELTDRDGPRDWLRHLDDDPWGTPYECRVLDGDDFEVRSAGPDRSFDTPDDLTSRDRSERPS